MGSTTRFTFCLIARSATRSKNAYDDSFVDSFDDALNDAVNFEFDDAPTTRAT